MPNGRDCLTLVTPQSWLGAHSSSAPHPGSQPLPSPPPRLCGSQSGDRKRQTGTRGRGRAATPRGGVRGELARGARPDSGSCSRQCGKSTGGAAAAAASSLGRSGSSLAVPGSYSLLPAPNQPVRILFHPELWGGAAPGMRRPRACRERAVGRLPGRGGDKPLGARCARAWRRRAGRRGGARLGVGATPLRRLSAPMGPAGGRAPGRCGAGGMSSLPEGSPWHTQESGVTPRAACPGPPLV